MNAVGFASSPGVNQVDGLPPVPNKDDPSASWPSLCERACGKLVVFFKLC
jgi:hypothetical protein